MTRLSIATAAGSVDDFDADPERLQGVEDRLSLIYQLARKHRCDPADLVSLHQKLRDELDQLTGGEAGIEGLAARLQQLEDELVRLEEKLSRQRTDAAPGFATKINEQLSQLAMAAATVDVSLTPLNGHGACGAETIELLVSTNPGQPHKPLNRVASGGELSRISLAIQVIAAQHTDIPTLVFDEVDVGVGGAVAEVVGKLLRALGENGQVICVTHLPQVASCAHQHLIASKHSDGNSTESQLEALSADKRIEEIARMLGGSTITKQTLNHAEEMLLLSLES